MSSANYVSRSGMLFSILLFTLNKSTVDAHGRYNVQCTNGHALLGHTFLNLTDTPMHIMDRCLAMCLQDCRCMSFQMCKSILCQLCSTNRDLNPLTQTKECNHFSFQRDYEKAANQQCHQGLFPDINCCLTSNPCQNNGLCEPNTPINEARRRFRCKCPRGYSGNICQDPVKSCRGYINGSRVPGKYKVFDDNMKLFEVFSDFDTNSTMAWTLIQSYQFQNNPQFRWHKFTQNHPVHEDSPTWDSYRLSQSRMRSVQDDSSKWRMTCRYDSDGLSYTDYVSSKEKIDILTYDRGMCVEVEFIDIRGNSCAGCTAVARQKNRCIFHVDSFYSKQRCSFLPGNSSSCNNDGEDNFGCYQCKNPSHRCSSSPTSTSQTWFGEE